MNIYIFCSRMFMLLNEWYRIRLYQKNNNAWFFHFIFLYLITYILMLLRPSYFKVRLIESYSHGWLSFIFILHTSNSASIVACSRLRRQATPRKQAGFGSHGTPSPSLIWHPFFGLPLKFIFWSHCKNVLNDRHCVIIFGAISCGWY